MLLPLGAAVWFVGDMSAGVKDALAAASTAQSTADKALEATQSLDVIQRDIEHQKQELDEIQRHLVTTKDELNRKLDRLIDLELGRAMATPR